MSPLVAAGFLVAYFLLAIETYLATYAIGRFKISWGPFGGTELRIVLARAERGRPLPSPGCPWAAPRGCVFDVLGVGATAALGVLAIVAGVRGTRALAREEGWAPMLPSPDERGVAFRGPSRGLPNGLSDGLPDPGGFSPPAPQRPALGRLQLQDVDQLLDGRGGLLEGGALACR